EGVHQPQRGGLAGAAAADEGQRLALGDAQRQAVEDRTSRRRAHRGAGVLDEDGGAHAPKPGASPFTSMRDRRAGVSPAVPTGATSFGASGQSRAASAWSWRRPTSISDMPPR